MLVLLSLVYLYFGFAEWIFTTTFCLVLIGSNYLYLKLYEVRASGNKIEVENLFHKVRLEPSEFVAIEKTFISPFAFKIVFKKDDYWLATDVITFYKSYFNYTPDFVLTTIRRRVVSITGREVSDGKDLSTRHD
jgi:hypothetical protein